MSYPFDVLLLKEAWREGALPNDAATLAPLLIKRFRESQKELMTAGKIQPGTVNERMKTLRYVGSLAP